MSRFDDKAMIWRVRALANEIETDVAILMAANGNDGETPQARVARSLTEVARRLRRALDGDTTEEGR